MFSMRLFASCLAFALSSISLCSLALSEPVSKGILERSQLNVGYTARIDQVFQSGRAGKTISIAVIGGSITAGAWASSPERQYGSLIADWWRKEFPKAKIEFTNAGVGATGSDYGAFRAKRDLLSRHPDFVIVEYGVNDADTQASAETLEGLVRQILCQRQKPAVLLLFMMYDQGGNAQNWESKVGLYYHLPMVSYRDALWPEIQSGRMNKSDIFHDFVHPNDRGHAYAAEFITHMLTTDLAAFPAGSAIQKIKTIPKPLFTDIYSHVHFYDAVHLKPIKNSGWILNKEGNYWMADKPGSVLECMIEGTQVDAFGFRGRGPMGRALVQVDNQSPVTLEGWFDQTWGGYITTDIVGTNLEAGKHLVKITLLQDKAVQSAGTMFELMGLGGAGIGR